MTSVLNVTSPRTMSWNVTSRAPGTRKRIAARLARRDAARDVVGRIERAATAAVLGRQARGERRLPLGLELLRRAETASRRGPRRASRRAVDV